MLGLSVLINARTLIKHTASNKCRGFCGECSNELPAFIINFTVHVKVQRLSHDCSETENGKPLCVSEYRMSRLWMRMELPLRSFLLLRRSIESVSLSFVASVFTVVCFAAFG